MRSLEAECSRDPVKRQMIVMDARPSTNDDAAQTIRLRELASNPAMSPTIPSMLIHTSDAHESWRARFAARCQAASRLVHETDGAEGSSNGNSVVATTKVYAAWRGPRCCFEACFCDSGRRCCPTLWRRSRPGGELTLFEAVGQICGLSCSCFVALRRSGMSGLT